MGGIEKRALATASITDGRRLVGYAALFNTPAVIAGEYSEMIMPGAFTASLAESRDILALSDHDAAKVLWNLC